MIFCNKHKYHIFKRYKPAKRFENKIKFTGQLFKITQKLLFTSIFFFSFFARNLCFSTNKPANCRRFELQMRYSCMQMNKSLFADSQHCNTRTQLIALKIRLFELRRVHSNSGIFLENNIFFFCFYDFL